MSVTDTLHSFVEFGGYFPLPVYMQVSPVVSRYSSSEGQKLLEHLDVLSLLLFRQGGGGGGDLKL